MFRTSLLTTTAALTVLAASAAFAADLPANRPYYKAEPMVASSWTGSYIGVNVGYGVTRSDFSNSLVGPTGIVAIGNSGKLAADGVIGGAQIGYNWQFSPTWLWGIEADFQGSGVRGSDALVIAGLGSASLESKLNWFGTVRGRLGWIVNPATVAYVTGGFAYGETEINLSNALPAPAFSGSAKQTRGGYTVGGGMETKLWGNWSAKAEYLYVDLGNNNLTIPTAVAGLSQVGSVDFRSHIVRAGLNYRF